MFNDDFDNGFAAGVVLMIVFLGVLAYFGNISIHSPERIEPSMKIEIEDGVADTTFIYKRKDE